MQDRKRETADALQNVGGDSSRKRRAITHTFIIIALSGTVCKDKKSSAKRVFTGSYGILTNRPYGERPYSHRKRPHPRYRVRHIRGATRLESDYQGRRQRDTRAVLV